MDWKFTPKSCFHFNSDWKCWMIHICSKICCYTNSPMCSQPESDGMKRDLKALNKLESKDALCVGFLEERGRSFWMTIYWLVREEQIEQQFLSFYSAANTSTYSITVAPGKIHSDSELSKFVQPWRCTLPAGILLDFSPKLLCSRRNLRQELCSEK